MAGQSPDKPYRRAVIGWQKHVESMLHKRLLLELFDEGRVHIEVDEGSGSRVLNGVVGEDVRLDGHRINHKIQVWMIFVVPAVAHEQSPGSLLRELVPRQVNFLDRWIRGHDHELLYCVHALVLDLVVAQVDGQHYLSGLEKVDEEGGTTLRKGYLVRVILL